MARIASGIALAAILALSLWFSARLVPPPWDRMLRTAGATVGAAAVAVVAFGVLLARL